MRVFKLKVSVGGFLFFLSSPPQTTQCPSVLTPSQMTALFQRYLHFKATQSGLSTHVTLHRMNEGSPSIPQKKCSMLIGCLYPTPQDSRVRLTRDDNVYSQSRLLLLWAEVLCGAAVLPESSIDRGRAVSRMIRWNESSPVKRCVTQLRGRGCWSYAAFKRCWKFRNSKLEVFIMHFDTVCILKVMLCYANRHQNTL